MSRVRSASASAPLVALALAFASGAPALAHLTGATPEVKAVADPAAEVARRDTGPGRRWIAWRVPSRTNRTIGCFGDWNRGEVKSCGCSLAKRQSNWGSSSDFPERGGDLEIYAAIEGGAVTELLLASENCAVDAKGERVTVLQGADPARGVALLSGLARPALRNGKGGKHDDDLAEKALATIAQHSTRDVPEASAAILAIAREAVDPEQRSHALFWLSQTDEPKAAAWIREAIARDADEDVREQAVFALSQLDDATDQLLAVLRDSRDRNVKRQALFWLGQSDDPRAIAEIERVLLR